jgi:hypothetical protein
LEQQNLGSPHPNLKQDFGGHDPSYPFVHPRVAFVPPLPPPFAFDQKFLEKVFYTYGIKVIRATKLQQLAIKYFFNTWTFQVIIISNTMI